MSSKKNYICGGGKFSVFGERKHIGVTLYSQFHIKSLNIIRKNISLWRQDTITVSDGPLWVRGWLLKDAIQPKALMRFPFSFFTLLTAWKVCFCPGADRQQSCTYFLSYALLNTNSVILVTKPPLILSLSSLWVAHNQITTPLISLLCYSIMQKSEPLNTKTHRPLCILSPRHASKAALITAVIMQLHYHISLLGILELVLSVLAPRNSAIPWFLIYPGQRLACIIKIYDFIISWRPCWQSKYLEKCFFFMSPHLHDFFSFYSKCLFWN